MQNDYWENVFYNPVFSPHPEVMHIKRKSFTEKNIEIKKNNKVTEKKVEEEKPVKTTEFILPKSNSVIEEEKKEEVKQETVLENKGLMPVNSVVYEIADEKEKKNFFRRKK